MPPTGAETGNRNFKLNQQLANWTDIDGTGIGFDSSKGLLYPMVSSDRQMPHGSNFPDGNV
jgi:Uma2 family endonuclease